MTICVVARTWLQLIGQGSVVVAEIQRKPNWEVWKHVPHAKVWEAVALSLDIDPEKVNIDSNSWMADRLVFHEGDEFSSRVFVAGRNVAGGKLRPVIIAVGQPEACTVSISEFASWALSISWRVPSELAALSECASPAKKPRSMDGALEGKGRATALKLILGMALGGYGYNPKARSGVPKEISDDLQRHGISVSDDTVRQWLGDAAQEIDWTPEEKD